MSEDHVCRTIRVPLEGGTIDAAALAEHLSRAIEPPEEDEDGSAAALARELDEVAP